MTRWSALCVMVDPFVSTSMVAMPMLKYPQDSMASTPRSTARAASTRDERDATTAERAQTAWYRPDDPEECEQTFFERAFARLTGLAHRE